MVSTTLDNRFGVTKFIVDPSAADGAYTTIQAAINAAPSNSTIFVKPGTYTENLTITTDNLNITTFTRDFRQVIIKGSEKDIVIKNPQVSKINMMGQETFQIVGEIEEVEKGPSEEDVNVVVEQAGCSEKEAVNALKENEGDIAKAILSLKK